jgi:hypothetical protein
MRRTVTGPVEVCITEAKGKVEVTDRARRRFGRSPEYTDVRSGL